MLRTVTAKGSLLLASSLLLAGPISLASPDIPAPTMRALPKQQAEPSVNPYHLQKIAKMSARRQAAIKKYFRRADQLYERGNFEAAVLFYARIVKLDEKNSLARLKMAKSLYKLGRFDEAYRTFATLKPEDLDPDSGYEFGQAALKSKDFETALAAFKRIPQGHPLFDLSNYYGAICAANLKRYREARDLMKQALVLPSKIVASRKAYMQHITEMIKKEEGPSETEGESNDKSSPGKKKKSSKKNVNHDPVATKEFWGKFIYKRNQVKVGYKNQDQSFDFDDADSLKESQALLFLDVALHPDFGKSEDQVTGFWLQTHSQVQVDQIVQDSNTIPIHPETLDSMLFYLEQTSSEEKSSSRLRAQIGLGPRWAYDNGLDLYLGAEYLSSMLDFDSEKGISMPRVFSQLSLDRNDFQSLLRMSYGSSSSTNGTLYDLLEGELGLRWFNHKKFLLEAKGRFLQFNYKQAEIDGPDWQFNADVSIVYSLTSRLQFYAGAHNDILAGNRVHGLASQSIIGFDQSNSGGKLGGKLNLWDQLLFDIGYEVENRLISNLKPDSNESRNALAAGYPSYISDLQINLAYRRYF